MARTINSPGVQITEKDLSVRASQPVGTNVLVPGFASQGPSGEMLVITSVSELEAVYGIPSTPAERYFYYSCREVLNSPAVLTTVRLPYGDGTGTAYANSYSGLFYPMLSGINTELSMPEWRIGAPTHVNLSPQQYFSILEGNFVWDNTADYTTEVETVTSTIFVDVSSTQFVSVTSLSTDGFGYPIEAGVDQGFQIDLLSALVFDVGGFPVPPLSGEIGYLVTVEEQEQTVVTQEPQVVSEQVTTVIMASSASVDLSGMNISSGFFILNDLQTTVNEAGEGFYVGFVDNTTVFADSPNFEGIRGMYTLLNADTYGTVSNTRLDFSLSATEAQSNRGIVSVSEQLEKVGFAGFSQQDYQDHISLGVFRIRRSLNDDTVLTVGTTERYLGSFDYNRKQPSTLGGTPVNAFISDLINQNSPTIRAFVNPVISQTFPWAENSNVPLARVTVDNTAKALFPVGVYVANTRDLEMTKVIGSVPAKLDRALRAAEVVENVTVDVIVDAGLSTIYSVSQANGTTGFDDIAFVDRDQVIDYWRDVSNTLINFSENVRKDCMTLIDLPRTIFVLGQDTKVIDSVGRTFTQDILNPIKSTAGTYASNYAATYGNWVKIIDRFTNRKIWIPFSGYAAAVFARNDAIANPWSAPAGLNRGVFNVVDIAFNPNQKQRDKLYENSVNPVAFFSGDGFVVMGQKTLQLKPSAFDRINVRRLFLTLERATQRTLKYFVMEPNTSSTRVRAVNTIEPLFAYAKNTEGLYDYQIVADERNNTPDIIDDNTMVIDIYIKAVRTGEYINVNFISTRTGQSFSELI